MTISRFYDDRFTGSFYLSPTTRWESLWGDIPKESYQRIGNFLTNDELRTLLDPLIYQNESKDAWWHTDEKSIDFFINATKIAEKRFLNQKGLISKINDSIEVAELKQYSLEVMQIVRRIKDINHNFKFIPQTRVDNIPTEWFMAAELVLQKNPQVLNAKTVKFLAGDCWRQMKIQK